MSVVIGIDIGQGREPTGLAVVEEERRERKLHHIVRHLERLTIGTPYPEIAERLLELTTKLKDRHRKRLRVYADATGIGEPVVHLLGEEIKNATVYPVFFNHGDRRSKEGRQIILGKGYLVSRLKTLLQSGRLHLPRTTEAETLADELANYEIPVAEDANDRYGAFKVGTRDDLVTALGLAVHYEKPEVIPLEWWKYLP